jgi:hypothetical protein
VSSSWFPFSFAFAELAASPFDGVVYSNRAAVRLKREEHGLAIYDATKAIELNPSFAKAYYRRAVAQLAIMQPKSAAADLRKVLQFDPKNAMAKQQLDSTIKLMRRIDFEKAIAGKDEPLVTDKARGMLKDGMVVESSYDGPRIPAGGISQEFVDQMIEWFRSGKVRPLTAVFQPTGAEIAQTIHRRYAWQIVIGCYDALLKHGSLVEATVPEGGHMDVCAKAASVEEARLTARRAQHRRHAWPILRASLTASWRGVAALSCIGLLPSAQADRHAVGQPLPALQWCRRSLSPPRETDESAQAILSTAVHGQQRSSSPCSPSSKHSLLSSKRAWSQWRSQMAASESCFPERASAPLSPPHGCSSCCRGAITRPAT